MPWCQAAWSIPRKIPGTAINNIFLLNLKSPDSIWRYLIIKKIIGIAIADRQKAVAVGPTSLILTNKGLTPRQLAPKIRTIAINQIGGLFVKLFFKIL